MKVKEAFVTRENPAEIFSVIADELSTMPNTQVFVDYEIYAKLRRNSSEYHISSPNYFKSPHYYHDEDNFGGEEWLELNSNSVRIARGSFIQNCKGYMQLVEFHSSKIKDYTHYIAGFERLLLIRFNSEE